MNDRELYEEANQCVMRLKLAMLRARDALKRVPPDVHGAVEIIESEIGDDE